MDGVLGAERTCETCGTRFYIGPSQARETRYRAGRYCSRACKYEGQRGVRVTGTRYVRTDGYIAVKIGVREFELEHRLIAQQMLGRSLLPGEQVHHLNHDKQDNRPENLVIMSNAEHQRSHTNLPIQRRRISLVCENCGAAYERKASRAGATHYCSASCRSQAVSQRNWAEGRWRQR